MTEPLPPDTALGVRLAAIIARGQFTVEPRDVVDEMLAVAGGRGEILAQEAGTWAGFHEADTHMQPLVSALLGIPGARQWVELGRKRRGIRHTT